MPPYGRHPSPPTCQHTPAQYQVLKHCNPIIRSDPLRSAHATTSCTCHHLATRPPNTHTAASSLRRVRSFGQSVRQAAKRICATAALRPCCHAPLRGLARTKATAGRGAWCCPPHTVARQLFPSRLNGCLQNCAHLPPPRAFVLAPQSLLPRPCASTQKTPWLRQEAVTPPAARRQAEPRQARNRVQPRNTGFAELECMRSMRPWRELRQVVRRARTACSRQACAAAAQVRWRLAVSAKTGGSSKRPR
jgi:hypothetical protein